MPETTRSPVDQAVDELKASRPLEAEMNPNGILYRLMGYAVAGVALAAFAVLYGVCRIIEGPVPPIEGHGRVTKPRRTLSDRVRKLHQRAEGQ